MSECPICCETFNKSNRAKVTCPYGNCAKEACRNCVKIYLTSITTDPNCMHCNLALTDAFLNDSMTKAFMTKVFREHRTTVLLERELARMPETMGLASAERDAIKHEKAAAELMSECNEIYKNILIPLRSQWKEQFDAAYRARHPSGNVANSSAMRFTMPCPRDACRGFLSTQYKCGACDHFVCPDCLAIKGVDRNTEHKCNSDEVATATAIKNDTKPCPSCGARISKISGCDQMWCVGCHVAFSWRTGNIQNGIVHNPHFFEYQRTFAERNRGASRALGQCNTETIPEWSLLRLWVLNARKLLGESETITSMYQVCAHIEQVEINSMNDEINKLQNNQWLRVRYILGKIDKTELAKQLCIEDRKRKRLSEVMLVFQLVYTVTKDILWALANAPSLVEVENDVVETPLINEGIKSFLEVIAYANDKWLEISKIYNVFTPHIDTTYEVPIPREPKFDDKISYHPLIKFATTKQKYHTQPVNN